MKPLQFIFLFTSFYLQACVNNLGLPGVTTVSNASPSTVPSYSGVDPGNDGADVFTIKQVVKNSLNPGTTLDILGTGSGALGSFCIATNANGAGAYPYTCACTFEYSTDSYPNQKVDYPVTYREANLLRCSYSSIPDEVGQFNVSLHSITADIYSNAITVSLLGDGSQTDTSNSQLFGEVIRYQCQDLLTVPYAFQQGYGNLYDPLQSEDTSLISSKNFYTVNLGETVARYTSNSNLGPIQARMKCPSIFTPNRYLNALQDQRTASPVPALTNYINRNRVNMELFSKASLSSQSGDRNSYVMYPPKTGYYDRSTFYLARNSVGIFRIAVNSYAAPGLITNTNDFPSPLGYGAEPIPVSPGVEKCPSTGVSIPTGYHWVKVWLFRSTSNANRGYYAPSSVDQVSAVACNFGLWDSNAGTVIFDFCTPQTKVSVADGGTGNFYRRATLNQCFAPQGTNGQFWLNNDTKAVSADTYNAFDYVFVVTPPEVTSKEMGAITTDGSSTVNDAYVPFSCETSDDVSASVPPVCTPRNDVITQVDYGIKFHDVSSAGDPPGNDPNRPGVFPVCALQPDSN